MSFSWGWMALAGFLVAACSPDPVAARPSPPVDWRSFSDAGRENLSKPAPNVPQRQDADDYVAVLQSPQFSQLAARLDPDAHGSFMGSGDVYGRDKVVRLHELLFGAFDERAVVAARVLSTPSTQSIEWTLVGLQARDWMTIPPTHKRVAFNGITLLWTKDDGTIADVHIYFDAAVVKGQLGVGPKTLRDLPPPRQTAGEQRLRQMGTSVEMENVEVVRAELGALEAKDEGAYLSRIADNVEIDTLERSGPIRGKLGAKKYYTALDHAIAQLTATIDHVWGIEACAVVEYSFSGLKRGPMNGVPMMDNPQVVELNIVDVVELSDGRILRIRRYDGASEAVVDGP
jgi:ketosteroid isomerase-like protein